jgi:hypothetical protein
LIASVGGFERSQPLSDGIVILHLNSCDTQTAAGLEVAKQAMNNKTENREKSRAFVIVSSETIVCKFGRKDIFGLALPI